MRPPVKLLVATGWQPTLMLSCTDMLMWASSPNILQALRISATDLLYDNHRRCQKE